MNTLPIGAVIRKAELSIYKTGVTDEWTFDKNGTFYAHALDNAWDMNSINTLNPVLNWSTIPFTAASLDSARFNKDTDPVQTWYKFNVTKRLEPIHSAKEKFASFCINSVHEIPFWGSGGRLYFAASEYATQQNRPELNITYEKATNILAKNENPDGQSVVIIRNRRLSIRYTGEPVSASIYSLQGRLLYQCRVADSKEASVVSFDVSSCIMHGKYFLVLKGQTINQTIPFLISAR